MKNYEAKPITVSEYIAVINEQVKGIEVQITGEVSRVSKAVSGHVYFDLKDEKKDAVLNCVMWSQIYQTIDIEFEAGMRVVVFGSGEIYATRGTFSFKVRGIELAGEGVLLKKYEELKKRLTAEGLFEPARKRPIPEYPQRIGVVTSRTGAVINDITNNLGTFGFQVKLADARVEGPEAVMSLLDAMRLLKKEPIDVLIIARGGGSMESLQAFDNELLVREVVSYPVPVIAGIGHHKDVTLVALAADAHESTPTAAAMLLNESWQKALFDIQNFRQQIFASYKTILFRASEMLKITEYTKVFKRTVANIRDILESHTAGYVAALETIYTKIEERLKTFERVIYSNDPNRNLRIGYAIVHNNGKVVKKTMSVQKKSDITVRVSDGTIDAQVTNIHKE